MIGSSSGLGPLAEAGPVLLYFVPPTLNRGSAGGRVNGVPESATQVFNRWGQSGGELKGQDETVPGPQQTD